MWYDKVKKGKRSRLHFYGSTISVSNYVLFKDVSSCQDIGICIGGSKVPVLSFPDPGYCDEKNNRCPRVWIGSSPGHHPRSNVNRAYFAVDLQGMGQEVRPGIMRGDYQRPALMIFVNHNTHYDCIEHTEEKNFYYL